MNQLQRLQEQVAFIAEIDKLKLILRQTLLLDKSRQENDAEHSWHLAMMVMVLNEHSNRPVDVSKVLKMVLVHDLVEIDAGDTYAYDEQANLDKEVRELAAAERIFNLLPSDQALELRSLWDEFEARETAEAQFANSVDRMQPLMHNYLTGGVQWKKHGISRSQVIKRCEPIKDGSQTLWDYMLGQVDSAVEAGLLSD